MRRFSRLRVLIAVVLFAVCLVELLLVALAGSRNSTRDHLPDESRADTGSAGEKKSTSGAPKKPILSVKHAQNYNRAKSEGSTPANGTSQYNLDGVIANLSKPWTSNETRKASIRRKLNSIVNAKEFTVLTKNSTVPGQNLTFAINPDLIHNLTDEVYQMLPKESPFAKVKLERCSVIGNGGILANSYCGKKIDSSDFVFRCNTPPLKGYQKHAGTKSSLTSINPGGVIDVKYRRLKDIGYRTKFLRDMKAYGDLLIPAYGVNMPAYRTSMLALRLLRQNRSTTRGLIINPDHFRGLQDLWRRMGLKSRMTTGFYLASVALSVCNSIELYGFWPFAKGPKHRPVPYHYYDRLKISKGVHNFNWEFDVLYQLHMGGVLQMHAGPCT